MVAQGAASEVAELPSGYQVSFTIGGGPEDCFVIKYTLGLYCHNRYIYGTQKIEKETKTVRSDGLLIHSSKSFSNETQLLAEHQEPAARQLLKELEEYMLQADGFQVGDFETEEVEDKPEFGEFPRDEEKPVVEQATSQAPEEKPVE